MDTRIYVITHKKCSLPEEEGYYPLQVGASMHEDLGFEKDNTGDNISEKNDSYCELTGMYWIWKNITCDNVGICHYRRYYSDENASRILHKHEFEELLKNYDVLTAWSILTPVPLYPHFTITHRSPGMALCRREIEEYSPEYLEAFDRCMQGKLMTGGNMIVAKKAIFDEYCEWLFHILFRVEKEIHPELITDSYQKRIMGFLGERLMRVWLMMQDFRVKEVRMVQTDAEDSKIPFGRDI